MRSSISPMASSVARDRGHQFELRTPAIVGLGPLQRQQARHARHHPRLVKLGDDINFLGDESELPLNGFQLLGGSPRSGFTSWVVRWRRIAVRLRAFSRRVRNWLTSASMAARTSGLSRSSSAVWLNTTFSAPARSIPLSGALPSPPGRGDRLVSAPTSDRASTSSSTTSRSPAPTPGQISSFVGFVVA